MRCILDDGYLQGVVVAKIPNFATSFSDFVTAGATAGYAFYLLDFVDCKDVRPIWVLG